MIKKILLLQFLLYINFSFAQDTPLIEQKVTTEKMEKKDQKKMDQVNKYKLKYKVNCVQDKITDNQGNGFEGLYGTRNFRVILHGVAYRGGGNNYYHRTDKRNNKNPLPIDGLNNLLKKLIF